MGQDGAHGLLPHPLCHVHSDSKHHPTNSPKAGWQLKMARERLLPHCYYLSLRHFPTWPLPARVDTATVSCIWCGGGRQLTKRGVSCVTLPAAADFPTPACHPNICLCAVVVSVSLPALPHHPLALDLRCYRLGHAFIALVLFWLNVLPALSTPVSLPVSHLLVGWADRAHHLGAGLLGKPACHECLCALWIPPQ